MLFVQFTMFLVILLLRQLHRHSHQPVLQMPYLHPKHPHPQLHPKPLLHSQRRKLQSKQQPFRRSSNQLQLQLQRQRLLLNHSQRLLRQPSLSHQRQPHQQCSQHSNLKSQLNQLPSHCNQLNPSSSQQLCQHPKPLQRNLHQLRQLLTPRRHKHLTSFRQCQQLQLPQPIQLSRLYP